MRIAAIMPSWQTPLAKTSNPCKQITCRDCAVKVCKYKKIALSDDLKIFLLSGIDLHNKLCYNRRGFNKSITPGADGLQSAYAP